MQDDTEDINIQPDDNEKTNAENELETSQPEESSSSIGGTVSEEAVIDKTDDSEDEKDEKKNGESTISSDLIRGHINTIILRALYERDKYGYEIINDIEEKSHGQYTLKQPTLYSALKRLETQGYIKAYWKTDQVTLGGRRKYFTLTDSGKEITEKNLSEWEYSRTIIDSLISDKSFDFNNPAPKPVDFTILRDSVSRVPIVKNAENVEQQNQQTTENKQTAAQTETQQQQQVLQPATTTTATIAETTSQQQQAVQPTPPPTEAKPERNEEENKIAQAEENERRKVAHENYLKLVSEPIKNTERQRNEEAERADKLETERLLYNNRPETERDYKNLIDSIYNKTLINGSTTYYQQPTQQPQQQRRKTQTENYNRPTKNIAIVDKGRTDGVTIMPSDETAVTRATKTTYNKGATLLRSSIVVLAVMLIEFIFTLIFKNNLNTSVMYPVTILLLGLAQFAVCLVLFISGYGKHSVRPTGNGYIGASIILCVIAILIIAVMSFLLNMNASLASDVMKKLVIPAITALNIPIFAVSFKLFLG